MKIAGVNIGQTIVRRVVWVVVGVVVYAILGLFTGNARAANPPGATSCTSSACYYVDQGAAYSGCMSVANSAVQAWNGTRGYVQPKCDSSGTSYVCYIKVQYSAGQDPANWTACGTARGAAYVSTHIWSNACPVDQPWNETTKSCGSPCANAPDLGPQSVTGSTMACSGGCQYDQRSPGGIDICIGSGATMYCSASVWKKTGNTCTATDKPVDNFDPNKPVCAALEGGTASECVKPSGEHCVVGARGTTMCWSPGETGPRVTADGTQGADRVVAPATPTPPPNMKNPTPDGTATTKVGPTTYNTTNYNGTGSSGGQGNVGTGGKDGSAPGTGSGSGDGDGEGAGAPGSGVPGDLYTKTDKTIGSVYGDFKTAVSESPFITTAEGVFGGCSSGGGGCPMEAWSAPEWGIAFDLSQLCSGILASIIAFAGYVCFAGMAFFAFKVAVL